MRPNDKFFNNLESWYKNDFYVVMNGVALWFTFDIKIYKSDWLRKQLINICLFLLRINILFKTHLFVRENVRLYNCCGLVSTVYFVFNSLLRKLLRVVWLSD